MFSLSFHLSFCGPDRQSDAFKYDTLVADAALSHGAFWDVLLYIHNASRHARTLPEWVLLRRLVESAEDDLRGALQLDGRAAAGPLTLDLDPFFAEKSWVRMTKCRSPARTRAAQVTLCCGATAAFWRLCATV